MIATGPIVTRRDITIKERIVLCVDALESLLDGWADLASNLDYGV